MTNRLAWSWIVGIVSALLFWAPLAQAVDVPRYGVFEQSFTHSGSYTNPYLEASMTVTFTGPSRQTMTVDGFWDGGSTWRVRMTPSDAGAWSYVTSSANAGLNGKSGSFNCIASSKKGFIEVNPSFPGSFMYADGTPFLWIGDTNWDWAHLSTPFNGTFQNWVDTRASQGFTILQGTLHPALNGGAPRYLGNNEGGRIFNSVSAQTLNPGYFQSMDSRVRYIMGKGLALAFWFGWSNDWSAGMSGDRYKRYARYLVARYGAYNVIWGGPGGV